MSQQRNLSIDPVRTAMLAAGWRAAVCVDIDGNEECWLVSPDPEHRHGCACRVCAPHDQIDTDTTARRTPA